MLSRNFSTKQQHRIHNKPNSRLKKEQIDLTCKSRSTTHVVYLEHQTKHQLRTFSDPTIQNGLRKMLVVSLLEKVVAVLTVICSYLLGEKKLATVICPDTWKDGARNTTESGGRKLGENKLLSKSKRYSPYSTYYFVCLVNFMF